MNTFLSFFLPQSLSLFFFFFFPLAFLLFFFLVSLSLSRFDAIRARLAFFL